MSPEALSLGIVFFAGGKATKSGKNIKQNKELLRRLILQLASREDGDVLSTPAGKEAFKERIRDEAQSQLGLNLNAIYFRNFVLAE